MLAVNLTNLKLDLFARHILTKVDWEIHDDRCVGLIGANGAGKSSLLKLIAGELTPDGGSITRAKGLTIGYLQQDPALDPDRTALEEALSASTELHALEDDLRQIEHKLERSGDLWQRPKRWTRTLETQQRLLERYEELGGAELREARARHAARAGPGRSGFQQQGRQSQRRAEETRGAGQTADYATAPAAARRAGQPSRSERQSLSGTHHQRLSRRGGDRLARSLSARSRRGRDRRAGSGPHHDVARHVFRICLRKRNAPGAAAAVV